MITKGKSGKTGPEPLSVALKGRWEASIGKALAKKKPAAGWPTDQKGKKKPAK